MVARMNGNYGGCSDAWPGPTAPEVGNTPEVGEAILVIGSDRAARNHLEVGLRRSGARVWGAGDAEEARALAERCQFDLVVADIDPPGPTSGLDLARQLREIWCGDTNVILVTSAANFDVIVGALQDDSVDLIGKPFRFEQLHALIKRIRDRRQAERENYLLQREVDRRPAAERMIGDSEAIREVRRIIKRIAPMPSTVLLKGETGTGKELAARALHDLSGRRGSYVPLNCAAISPELFEGELFGHAKGAFTGAHQARQGLFSHADRGTLFLDEIAEMPLGMQAKLLRVLEARCYRPVGGNHEVAVNARVIAATNRDLAAEVLAGRFRKDLYYRINVVDLHLPPLRERKSDIAGLARLFLNVISKELGVPEPELADQELALMLRYDWPGNIRELRNVIERSLLLGKPTFHFLPPPDPQEAAGEACVASPLTLEHKERTHILAALRDASGNKTLAARALGISRKTVERKLRQWSSPGTRAGLA